MSARQRKRTTASDREFELGSSELIAEIRKSGGQVVLTRNGRAAGVAVDLKSYRHMMDQARQLEDIKAIRRGLEAANRGETRPWAEVDAEIRGKLGLPRRRHGAGRG
jgi:PHD/YefM family antitoxin component YafN of YafNO toxin-antitoxin module